MARISQTLIATTMPESRHRRFLHRDKRGFPASALFGDRLMVYGGNVLSPWHSRYVIVTANGYLSIHQSHDDSGVGLGSQGDRSLTDLRIGFAYKNCHCLKVFFYEGPVFFYCEDPFVLTQLISTCILVGARLVVPGAETLAICNSTLRDWSERDLIEWLGIYAFELQHFVHRIIHCFRGVKGVDLCTYATTKHDLLRNFLRLELLPNETPSRVEDFAELLFRSLESVRTAPFDRDAYVVFSKLHWMTAPYPDRKRGLGRKMVLSLCRPECFAARYFGNGGGEVWLEEMFGKEIRVDEGEGEGGSEENGEGEENGIGRRKKKRKKKKGQVLPPRDSSVVVVAPPPDFPAAAAAAAADPSIPRRNQDDIEEEEGEAEENGGVFPPKTEERIQIGVRDPLRDHHFSIDGEEEESEDEFDELPPLPAILPPLSDDDDDEFDSENDGFADVSLEEDELEVEIEEGGEGEEIDLPPPVPPDGSESEPEEEEEEEEEEGEIVFVYDTDDDEEEEEEGEGEIEFVYVDENGAELQFHFVGLAVSSREDFATAPPAEFEICPSNGTDPFVRISLEEEVQGEGEGEEILLVMTQYDVLLSDIVELELDDLASIVTVAIAEEQTEEETFVREELWFIDSDDDGAAFCDAIQTLFDEAEMEGEKEEEGEEEEPTETIQPEHVFEEEEEREEGECLCVSLWITELSPYEVFTSPQSTLEMVTFPVMYSLAHHMNVWGNVRAHVCILIGSSVLDFTRESFVIPVRIHDGLRWIHKLTPWRYRIDLPRDEVSVRVSRVCCEWNRTRVENASTLGHLDLRIGTTLELAKDIFQALEVPFPSQETLAARFLERLNERGVPQLMCTPEFEEVFGMEEFFQGGATQEGLNRVTRDGLSLYNYRKEHIPGSPNPEEHALVDNCLRHCARVARDRMSDFPEFELFHILDRLYWLRDMVAHGHDIPRQNPAPEGCVFSDPRIGFGEQTRYLHADYHQVYLPVPTDPEVVPEDDASISVPLLLFDERWKGSRFDPVDLLRPIDLCPHLPIALRPNAETEGEREEEEEEEEGEVSAFAKLKSSLPRALVEAV